MEPAANRCDALTIGHDRSIGSEFAMIRTVSFIPSLALCAAATVTPTSAFAQSQDHAPVSLPSSSRMTQDAPGTESWTYAQPQSAFAKYRTAIVDATTVYRGPDAQFEGIDSGDRD